MRTDAGDSVTGSKSRKASSYLQGPRHVSGTGWVVTIEDADGGKTSFDFETRRAGQLFVNQVLEEGKAERRLRGFAVMTKERHRAIASKGGLAAQASGKAHQFTPEEAQRAGRRGGAAAAQDREHMAAIGRKGGIERGRRARDRREQRGKRARAEA
ncbi:MAG: hypothetical protein U1A78_32090 [Polyangia bacterium]